MLHENTNYMKELDILEQDNPDLKEKLLEFIETQIKFKALRRSKIFHDGIYNIFNHGDPKYDISDKTFIDSVNNVWSSSAGVNSVIADIYTISRIFKKFNMEKIQEKAYYNGATDQPERAHNIIIYAGDFHAQTYRKFLKDVLNFDKLEVAGKEEPYDKVGEKLYCLDMKKILPFFSKWEF